MIACVLFIIAGTTNYVTPGCLQGTGIVTPTEVVHVTQIPKAYKKQLSPYYRKVIKFDDTIVFHGIAQFNNYKYHYKIARTQPNNKRYQPLGKWIKKRLRTRYRFHLNLRVRGVRGHTRL